LLSCLLRLARLFHHHHHQHNHHKVGTFLQGTEPFPQPAKILRPYDFNLNKQELSMLTVKWNKCDMILRDYNNAASSAFENVNKAAKNLSHAYAMRRVLRSFVNVLSTPNPPCSLHHSRSLILFSASFSSLRASTRDMFTIRRRSRFYVW